MSRPLLNLPTEFLNEMKRQTPIEGGLHIIPLVNKSFASLLCIIFLLSRSDRSLFGLRSVCPCRPPSRLAFDLSTNQQKAMISMYSLYAIEVYCTCVLNPQKPLRSGAGLFQPDQPQECPAQRTSKRWNT